MATKVAAGKMATERAVGKMPMETPAAKMPKDMPAAKKPMKMPAAKMSRETTAEMPAETRREMAVERGALNNNSTNPLQHTSHTRPCSRTSNRSLWRSNPNI